MKKNYERALPNHMKKAFTPTDNYADSDSVSSTSEGKSTISI